MVALTDRLLAITQTTTGASRDDQGRRRVLGQYKSYLLENRVSVLKVELAKLAASSSELIPAAAELQPPRTYTEMAAILREDLNFLDFDGPGEAVLLATPTGGRLPTVRSIDHIE
jgi:hypothetical protein